MVTIQNAKSYNMLNLSIKMWKSTPKQTYKLNFIYFLVQIAIVVFYISIAPCQVTLHVFTDTST